MKNFRLRPLLTLTAVAAAMLSLSAPLLAETPQTITITGVTFSADSDVMTVTLSRAPTATVEIRYTLSKVGDTSLQRQGIIDTGSGVTIAEGFQATFLSGHTGTYRIDFAVCPPTVGTQAQHIDGTCGSTFTKTLQYTEPSATDVIISSADLSGEFDRMTVTLARSPAAAMELRYILYKDSLTITHQKVAMASATNILLLSGMFSTFDDNGPGAYRFDFAVCPRSAASVSPAIDGTCGPTFTKSVLYVVPPPTDITVSSLHISTNLDRATVTLSRTPNSKIELRYFLYRNAETEGMDRGYVVTASGTTTIDGLGTPIQNGGAGTYRFDVAACARSGSQTTVLDSTCGPTSSTSLPYAAFSPNQSISCCLQFADGGTLCNQMTAATCANKGGSAFSSGAACAASCFTSTAQTMFCCVSNQCRSLTSDACHALQGSAYTSQVECTSHCSNVVTIPETPAPIVTPVTPLSAAPSAVFADPVLPDIATYRNPFPDTDLSILSGRAEAELFRRSVIGGFPDGEFKGGRPVNRAEAAKFLLLARYGNVDDRTNNRRFSDVTDGQWYVKYVVTAADWGIINGYPDKTFRPANQVNTAEFIKMLSLIFALPLNQPSSYVDVPAGSWYARYAGIAQKYDLFPGRGTTLRPNLPLTRENVAVAIYQYLSRR